MDQDAKADAPTVAPPRHRRPRDPWPRRPLPDVLDDDFLAQRANLLELAAFLDRCDRAAPAPGQGEAEHEAVSERRLEALRAAVLLTTDDRGDRVRRMLELWSDPEEGARSAPPVGAVTGIAPPPPQTLGQS